MATDHVLITLSDFKQICTDLKRTGDLIKGVVRVTHEAKKTTRKNAKLLKSKEICKAKKRKSPSGDESSGSRRKSRRSKSPTKPESEPNSAQSDTDSSTLSAEDGF